MKDFGIMYTCHGSCGIQRRRIFVNRRRNSQDVVDWLKDIVSIAISKDHKRVAPYCTAQNADIALPLAEEGNIGEVPKPIPEDKDIPELADKMRSKGAN